jgi:hypothetical protein
MNTVAPSYNNEEIDWKKYMPKSETPRSDRILKKIYDDDSLKSIK